MRQVQNDFLALDMRNSRSKTVLPRARRTVSEANIPDMRLRRPNQNTIIHRGLNQLTRDKAFKVGTPLSQILSGSRSRILLQCPVNLALGKARIEITRAAMRH